MAKYVARHLVAAGREGKGERVIYKDINARNDANAQAVAENMLGDMPFDLFRLEPIEMEEIEAEIQAA